MSRYIDADATELAVVKATTYGDALRAVREQPSIDIVRCKECKYWAKRKFTDGSGEIWEEEVCDHRNITAPTADDFCSYGERSR